MKKRGVSTITLVLGIGIVACIACVCVILNFKASAKKQFIKTIQNEAIEIDKKIVKEVPKIKKINADIKSAIDYKKNIYEKNNEVIDFINKSTIRIESKYKEKSAFSETDILVEKDLEDVFTAKALTQSSMLNVSLGELTEDKYINIKATGIKKFVLTTLSLEQKDKAYIYSSILDYVKNNIQNKQIIKENKSLNVDEVSVDVNKISISLTSQEFKDISKKIITQLEENKKIMTALDSYLLAESNINEDAVSMFKDVRNELETFTKEHTKVSIALNLDKVTGKLLNYSVEAISASKEVPSKRICINKIATNDQDFSVTYLENITPKLAYKAKEDMNQIKAEGIIGNHRLDFLVNKADLKNISYMYSNSKTNSKATGNISIANIESKYQATVTLTGLIADKVINATISANIQTSEGKEFKNFPSFGDIIDKTKINKASIEKLKADILNIIAKRK
ncbi:MAG: hypothetical protein RR922_05985 [Clostridia bacterium]